MFHTGKATGMNDVSAGNNIMANLHLMNNWVPIPRLTMLINLGDNIIWRQILTALSLLSYTKMRQMIKQKCCPVWHLQKISRSFFKSPDFLDKKNKSNIKISILQKLAGKIACQGRGTDTLLEEAW